MEGFWILLFDVTMQADGVVEVRFPDHGWTFLKHYTEFLTLGDDVMQCWVSAR